MKRYFTKSYWKFLLKSTNQHGVHSPFVYQLVTNCFYNTNKINTTSLDFPKELSNKHISILANFIQYFSINSYFVAAPATHGIFKFLTHLKRNNTEIEYADFIYVSAEKFASGLTEILIQKFFSNTVIIIETPYQNEKHWISLKKKESSRVIVDTYFFGFIFYRKQQAKEEFFIRI